METPEPGTTIIVSANAAGRIIAKDILCYYHKISFSIMRMMHVIKDALTFV
jgi:hypothetical protein